jgi:hypothetical protein
MKKLRAFIAIPCLKVIGAVVLVIAAAFLMSTCGGSDGGGGSSGAPVSSSKWDSMVWDQGKWE